MSIITPISPRDGKWLFLDCCLRRLAAAAAAVPPPRRFAPRPPGRAPLRALLAPPRADPAVLPPPPPLPLPAVEEEGLLAPGELPDDRPLLPGKGPYTPAPLPLPPPPSPRPASPA
ncbi:unnamed protein product, partial [Ectocarpus sp. 12 AP-2014]